MADGIVRSLSPRFLAPRVFAVGRPAGIRERPRELVPRRGRSARTGCTELATSREDLI